MWVPEVAVVDKIVRSVVYAFLLLVFRVLGKRQLGQITFVAWLTYRYKRAERLVEHAPTIRQQGVMSLKQVRFALLEEDGCLSVIRREPNP